MKCHHCHAETQESAHGNVLEAGVTSDCRPWKDEVRIFVCPTCGAVQAPIDERWRRSVQSIYRDYDTYAAAGGEEQKVAGADAAGMSARSRVIVEWLASLGSVPARGEVLDVGCGRGAFLKEFARQFPDWALSGTEFDDRNLGVLQSLPKWKNFQTAGFEDLVGQYDVISMIHVLEHIENPVACLAALRKRARNGALLVVQVPDWMENPFALAIADHATHFTSSVLQQVARKAGWEPLTPPSHIVPKELTLLAKASENGGGSAGELDEQSELRLNERLAWLRGVQHQAQQIRAESDAFGIFGTAVAGSWLAGACNIKVDFFVDEDPNRIGGEHLGIPIIAPGDAPPGANVFVGMAPAVSRRLAEKYSGSPARFHAVDSISAL
jgi:2-polyprenyl-3-methyl-5-hydroxy-6-metoxy-1,4-benzoquinol methylase